MRKFIVTLMASLLSCSAAFAFWPEATDSSLEVGVGYRQDRLEWKTSSRFGLGYGDYGNSYGDYSSSYSDDHNGGSSAPGRLQSKLKWRDLEIFQIEARGKYVTCDNIYLRACGDYGWITSGKNRDSDSVRFGSGSDFEFANSHSKVRGHVYDAKIAAGYQFKMCDDSFSIAPLVGYSWHGQHLEDRHLRQNCYAFDDYSGSEDIVFGDASAARSYYSYFDTYGSYDRGSYDSDESYSFDHSSSFSGNHSRYHTRWNGPFIGFDFDYRFGCGCEWDVFGGYEFHWATYHAKARWNLRPDLFDGFHHRAKDAYGHVFDIGVKYDFCECWTVALRGQFQWWWADHGRDRAKIADCKAGDVRTDCFLSIPLRDVRWDSASVSVDVGMVF